MKKKYGENWQNFSNDQYLTMFNSCELLHQKFNKYLHNLEDWKTVLEIGCGTGIYPITFAELFLNKDYTGIDISKGAIDYAKTQSNSRFICGDFLKTNFEQKFDLVFSHAVIDHIYDIDLFIEKIAKTCKKHAYISAYNGYYEKLKKHEMFYREKKGNYLNRLSPFEIEKTLLNIGLTAKEFSIYPEEVNNKVFDIKYETIIEIKKSK